jgi:signal transduction histidine kinase
MGETAEILVIEDELRLRNNLKVLLSNEGYRVTTAENGADGIRKAGERPYDLVITDLVMPEVDGFQVMNYLKAHLPDTVVLAMTGYVSSESAIAALRHGAYDYLTKPFDVDIMKLTIERALEKVRLQQALRRYMSELEQKVEERTKALTDTNKKLEQSLVDLKAVQEHLIQAEKLSALGELIAGVAHELANPLNTISMTAQLLMATSTLPPRDRGRLEKLGQAAVHCSQIVKGLVSFARKQKPELACVDVNALCEQALDLLAYQMKASKIQLERHLDPRLPRTMADPHQLQQVFVNIGTNACQAMAGAAGRGTLTVETTAADGVIRIAFHDDGPGMSKEQQRKIFDPFFTTKPEGTGLGLSISYGIIREHAGDIAVESVPGRGATFVVSVPVRPSPEVVHEAGPVAAATS